MWPRRGRDSERSRNFNIMLPLRRGCHRLRSRLLLLYRCTSLELRLYDSTSPATQSDPLREDASAPSDQACVCVHCLFSETVMSLRICHRRNTGSFPKLFENNSGHDDMCQSSCYPGCSGLPKTSRKNCRRSQTPSRFLLRFHISCDRDNEGPNHHNIAIDP